MVKELSDGVTETQILQKLWKKLSVEKIIYDNGMRALHVTLPQTRIIFIFFVYIFIHNLANKSPFGLKFSQMILHTETSKLVYNWSFLFVVLHKPTLLPSTFNTNSSTKTTFVININLDQTIADNFAQIS